MKRILLKTIALIGLAGSLQAASFDSTGFGTHLGGWRKDGTAVYEFTDAKYRTHRPTITQSPSGALFLSTQVDMLSAAGKGAICQLGLTFSREGKLESIQIKATVRGKALDTGVVRPTEAPAEAEGAPKRGGLSPVDEMVVEVFRLFDTEMKKVTEAEGGFRSDLAARLSGNNVTSADLTAGLRHNVNLMLQHVSAR